MERNEFYKKYQEYYGYDINDIPSMVKCKKIELYDLYSSVLNHGGYSCVSRNAKWLKIAKEFGLINKEKNIKLIETKEIKEYYLNYLREFERIHDNIKKGKIVTKKYRNCSRINSLEIKDKKKLKNNKNKNKNMKDENELNISYPNFYFNSPNDTTQRNNLINEDNNVNMGNNINNLNTTNNMNNINYPNYMNNYHINANNSSNNNKNNNKNSDNNSLVNFTNTNNNNLNNMNIMFNNFNNYVNNIHYMNNFTNSNYINNSHMNNNSYIYNYCINNNINNNMPINFSINNMVNNLNNCSNTNYLNINYVNNNYLNNNNLNDNNVNNGCLNSHLNSNYTKNISDVDKIKEKKCIDIYRLLLAMHKRKEKIADFIFCLNILYSVSTMRNMVSLKQFNIIICLLLHTLEDIFKVFYEEFNIKKRSINIMIESFSNYLINNKKNQIIKNFIYFNSKHINGYYENLSKCNEINSQNIKKDNDKENNLTEYEKTQVVKNEYDIEDLNKNENSNNCKNSTKIMNVLLNKEINVKDIMDLYLSYYDYCKNKKKKISKVKNMKKIKKKEKTEINEEIRTSDYDDTFYFSNSSYSSSIYSSDIDNIIQKKKNKKYILNFYKNKKDEDEFLTKKSCVEFIYLILYIINNLFLINKYNLYYSNIKIYYKKERKKKRNYKSLKKTSSYESFLKNNDDFLKELNYSSYGHLKRKRKFDNESISKSEESSDENCSQDFSQNISSASSSICSMYSYKSGKSNKLTLNRGITRSYAKILNNKKKITRKNEELNKMNFNEVSNEKVHRIPKSYNTNEKQDSFLITFYQDDMDKRKNTASNKFYENNELFNCSDNIKEKNKYKNISKINNVKLNRSNSSNCFFKDTTYNIVDDNFNQNVNYFMHKNVNSNNLNEYMNNFKNNNSNNYLRSYSHFPNIFNSNNAFINNFNMHNNLCNSYNDYINLKNNSNNSNIISNRYNEYNNLTVPARIKYNQDIVNNENKNVNENEFSNEKNNKNYNIGNQKDNNIDNQIREVTNKTDKLINIKYENITNNDKNNITEESIGRELNTGESIYKDYQNNYNNKDGKNNSNKENNVCDNNEKKNKNTEINNNYNKNNINNKVDSIKNNINSSINNNNILIDNNDNSSIKNKCDENIISNNNDYKNIININNNSSYNDETILINNENMNIINNNNENNNINDNNNNSNMNNDSSSSSTANNNINNNSNINNDSATNSNNVDDKDYDYDCNNNNDNKNSINISNNNESITSINNINNSSDNNMKNTKYFNNSISFINNINPYNLNYIDSNNNNNKMNNLVNYNCANVNNDNFLFNNESPQNISMPHPFDFNLYSNGYNYYNNFNSVEKMNKGVNGLFLTNPLFEVNNISSNSKCIKKDMNKYFMTNNDFNISNLNNYYHKINDCSPIFNNYVNNIDNMNHVDNVFISNDNNNHYYKYNSDKNKINNYVCVANGNKNTKENNNSDNNNENEEDNNNINNNDNKNIHYGIDSNDDNNNNNNLEYVSKSSYESNEDNNKQKVRQIYRNIKNSMYEDMKKIFNQKKIKENKYKLMHYFDLSKFISLFETIFLKNFENIIYHERAVQNIYINMFICIDILNNELNKNISLKYVFFPINFFEYKSKFKLVAHIDNNNKFLVKSKCLKLEDSEIKKCNIYEKESKKSNKKNSFNITEDRNINLPENPSDNKRSEICFNNLINSAYTESRVNLNYPEKTKKKEETLEFKNNSSNCVENENNNDYNLLKNKIKENTNKLTDDDDILNCSNNNYFSKKTMPTKELNGYEYRKKMKRLFLRIFRKNNNKYNIYKKIDLKYLKENYNYYGMISCKEKQKYKRIIILDLHEITKKILLKVYKRVNSYLNIAILSLNILTYILYLIPKKMFIVSFIPCILNKIINVKCIYSYLNVPLCILNYNGFLFLETMMKFITQLTINKVIPMHSYILSFLRICSVPLYICLYFDIPLSHTLILTSLSAIYQLITYDANFLATGIIKKKSNNELSLSSDKNNNLINKRKKLSKDSKEQEIYDHIDKENSMGKSVKNSEFYEESILRNEIHECKRDNENLNINKDENKNESGYELSEERKKLLEETFLRTLLLFLKKSIYFKSIFNYANIDEKEEMLIDSNKIQIVLNQFNINKQNIKKEKDEIYFSNIENKVFYLHDNLLLYALDNLTISNHAKDIKMCKNIKKQYGNHSTAENTFSHDIISSENSEIQRLSIYAHSIVSILLFLSSHHILWECLASHIPLITHVAFIQTDISPSLWAILKEYYFRNFMKEKKNRIKCNRYFDSKIIKVEKVK
ncbi:conserved Plasmodium protein, unknown function [Plasmodium relictum]|uniref:ARID domain-containing protein n=1 Tax=Plasmodium relictum TaxID=85471 RepID=A0A1J1H877_PLARL|nr:conserved Plasmodium protein, unknown function [Plasmodium relictum]CRH01098.1 conserved Plasmodium protein, unknown function [Plasmodium relictum]